jgi:hypothetical protein
MRLVRSSVTREEGGEGREVTDERGAKRWEGSKEMGEGKGERRSRGEGNLDP